MSPRDRGPWSAGIVALLLAPHLLAGCGEPTVCADFGHAIGFTEDAPPPLDVSAAELPIEFGPSETAYLVRWNNGREDRALELTIEPSEVAHYIDGEEATAAVRADRPRSEIVCDDRLTLDVRVRFVTADGGFDEDLVGIVLASTTGDVALTSWLDLTDVHGDYEMSDLVHERYSDPRLRFAFHFDTRCDELDTKGTISELGTVDCAEWDSPGCARDYGKVTEQEVVAFWERVGS